mgnify:CR=1 FL=1
MPPGSTYPHRFRPPCGGWRLVLRRVLVHHVLLTLVFLPFVQGHGLPLAGMFPVYLAASFVPAAVLTAMSSPVSKAVKKLA